jgi:hypothetical protein
MMKSPGNENEAGNARTALLTLLDKWGLTEANVPAILAATEGDGHANAGSSSSRPSSEPSVNVLDMIMVLIEEHVVITAEERMAVALWILHTHVYNRFPITPRLALLSPVRGCGKSTALTLIELLAANPYRTDSITAAALYHILDGNPATTLLIDEGDNAGLSRDRVLRTVLNSGHSKHGGGADRFVGGWPRKFRVFAPVAIAAIGMLPLPLLQRTVVIDMQRRPYDSRIRRLSDEDFAFVSAPEEICKWAATCSLNRNPEIPQSLRDRIGDNWIALFSVADALGHGAEARTAAIMLCANRPDEDIGVVLLTDIRRIFYQLGVDRLASAALVKALHELDDGAWSE